MSHTFHLANPGLRLDNRTGSLKGIYYYLWVYIGGVMEKNMEATI